MSKNEAIRLVNDMANNPELIVSMDKMETNEALAAFIADAGYDFTPEEMKEAIQNLEPDQLQVRELSEDELDQVVGAGPFSAVWGGCKKVARPIAVAGRRIIHGETKDQAQREVDYALGGGSDLIDAGDQIADGVDDIVGGIVDIKKLIS